MKAETLDLFKIFEAAKTNALATKEDVANAKADMIKWMFIFWIGQIAATFGFIILYLKK